MGFFEVSGGVAQLVRVPACHAGCRGFESRLSRFFYLVNSQTPTFSLNISPCPNDTFAFCRLLQSPPFPIETRFLDIDLLNAELRKGEADFCKASFHAWFQEKQNYGLLPVGAALGFHCGPLLVSAKKNPEEIETIAVPGLQTTAYLLLQLYLKKPAKIKVLRFDEIMPRVQKGEVDAGLIIHESRFTYSRFGLRKIVDLGEWWHEQADGLPIPLGGVFYSKRLPQNKVSAFSQSLRNSIQWAWKRKDEALKFCREHAQEMEGSVMLQHVQLYVNDFALDLSEKGLQAIEALENKAREKKIL